MRKIISFYRCVIKTKHGKHGKKKLNEFYSFAFLIYLALGVKNIILLLAQNSVSSHPGRDVGKFAVADRRQYPSDQEHRGYY